MTECIVQVRHNGRLCDESCQLWYDCFCQHLEEDTGDPVRMECCPKEGDYRLIEEVRRIG